MFFGTSLNDRTSTTFMNNDNFEQEKEKTTRPMLIKQKSEVT